MCCSRLGQPGRPSWANPPPSWASPPPSWPTRPSLWANPPPSWASPPPSWPTRPSSWASPPPSWPTRPSVPSTSSGNVGTLGILKPRFPAPVPFLSSWASSWANPPRLGQPGRPWRTRPRLGQPGRHHGRIQLCPRWEPHHPRELPLPGPVMLVGWLVVMPSQTLPMWILTTLNTLIPLTSTEIPFAMVSSSLSLSLSYLCRVSKAVDFSLNKSQNNRERRERD